MVKAVRLGKKEVSNFADPYITVDCCSNHNGDMDLCKKMIDAAVECGVDAVKFQAWGFDIFSRSCYSDDERQQELMDKSPVLKKLFTEIHPQLKQEMEEYQLSKEQFREIKKYCDQKNITFFCTPLNKEWADFLVDELKMEIIKVASMDLNNYPFLAYLAKKGKPIILSTGMSSMTEILTAVETITKNGNNQIVILHCLSIYPTPPEITNLNNIDMLRDHFDFPIGFSYNSPGFTMPIAAVAKGACVIEQHFTIDKNLPGWDHKISAEPADMKIVVEECRKVQKALGKYHRIISDAELQKRHHFRRSIIVTRDMKAGEVITLNDIDYKRPGIGLEPEKNQFVIGRTLRRNLKEDDLISFDDLI
ncbi:MAG: N-acetylneuraminate synthase family protein [Nanoarchaeota archaeon]|nr:N-acetylneuraminate synthase family protein [Nanoarchaeota archaeon]